MFKTLFKEDISEEFLNFVEQVEELSVGRLINELESRHDPEMPRGEVFGGEIKECVIGGDMYVASPTYTDYFFFLRDLADKNNSPELRAAAQSYRSLQKQVRVYNSAARLEWAAAQEGIEYDPLENKIIGRTAGCTSIGENLTTKQPPPSKPGKSGPSF
ncbi:hypothetical protein CL689_07095 [Candidatus Saccharibacteria bacterium]|nr:hypothetical protein [Candidatus Saccharibacteria bacterium]